ncbi:TPA: GNAT family N-acetyltransferase [Candidatus Dependentiae bacterium]|nr:GNAT family N-acetyltransferase [Candidatus Dependentiae bacterium]HBZ73210.1 GNAT family N-acetyltransferase [Candidatus Dependentiae bacterium]
MEITIDFLKNYPQHISSLTKIAREELGPTWSPDEKQLRQYLNIDLLPLTLVALDNSAPVGMCSLTQTKGLRPDLTPWLGPLVVDKRYQRCGIGSQLIEVIKQKARILGFEKLYLCTHDPELATRYYQRRGWSIIGVDEWKGYSVTVMEINLGEKKG